MNNLLNVIDKEKDYGKIVSEKYVCTCSGGSIDFYECNENKEEWPNVIIRYDYGNANYLRIYKSSYLRVTDDSPEGKQKRLNSYIDHNGNPQAYFETISSYVERYCDYHNMFARFETSGFADTCSEALRILLLKFDSEESPERPEVYIRKDERFIFISDLAEDEEKWNEVMKDVKEVYHYYYSGYNTYEMYKSKMF